MSDRLIPWAQLWSQFRTMPDEMKIEVVKSLDAGELDGFERWLASRSPKVQVTILDNAPDELKRYLYDQGILSIEAINDLGIRSYTKVRDNRLKGLIR